MPEDTELLRRYVESRSQEAFAELVRRRIGLVYSVAFRLTRDAHRAEDVAQAVFTDLARKAPSLAQRPVLAGWLYRSAHYAAVDVLRAEQSRAKREREAQSMHEILGPNDGTETDAWEKIRPVLDEVISELSERDRDAVLLRFFDGRSFGDIAARLELTENAARMRVDRALDKLHGLLARRGVTSAATALGTLLAHQASAATAPAGLAAAVTSGSLASAGAAGAAATGMLQFMMSSKAMVGLTGVGLALVLGTTALERHAKRQIDATRDAVAGENTRLTGSLHALAEKADAADQDTARLRDLLANTRASQARQREAAAAATQMALEADRREADAFMARHPDVKQAFLDKNRAIAAGRYTPLLRSLGLSPAQTDEFLDLLAQRSSLRFVTASGMALGFVPEGDPRQREARLREILGAAGFAQFQAFNPEIGQITTELAGNLYASSSPLTLAQANQVAEILRAADLTPRQNGSMSDTPTSAAAYDWDAIMAKAREVLTEDQLKVLAAQSTARQYRQAMTLARQQFSASARRN